MVEEKKVQKKSENKILKHPYSDSEINIVEEEE